MDNTPLPNAILILLSIHGRPDQRIQHRLEYQYRLPVQHDAGIQRNGRAHHVPIL